MSKIVYQVKRMSKTSGTGLTSEHRFFLGMWYYIVRDFGVLNHIRKECQKPGRRLTGSPEQPISQFIKNFTNGAESNDPAIMAMCKRWGLDPFAAEQDVDLIKQKLMADVPVGLDPYNPDEDEVEEQDEAELEANEA